jgi:hypothetical protein
MSKADDKYDCLAAKETAQRRLPRSRSPPSDGTSRRVRSASGGGRFPSILGRSRSPPARAALVGAGREAVPPPGISGLVTDSGCRNCGGRSSGDVRTEIAKFAFLLRSVPSTARERTSKFESHPGTPETDSSREPLALPSHSGTQSGLEQRAARFSAWFGEPTRDTPPRRHRARLLRRRLRLALERAPLRDRAGGCGSLGAAALAQGEVLSAGAAALPLPAAT